MSFNLRTIATTALVVSTMLAWNCTPALAKPVDTPTATLPAGATVTIISPDATYAAPPRAHPSVCPTIQPSLIIDASSMIRIRHVELLYLPGIPFERYHE
ncbi:hypothetical protein H4R33_003617 [Dimargaris cristalligena]|nr:hypothetical protein H4R33_003617 [Dimargaris cristalligena]